MLTAGEIASMQAQAEDAFSETCEIGRRAEVSDGGGGRTVSFPTIAVVACMRAPAMRLGSEPARGEQSADESLWTITLPAGTDVRADDRLTIDGTGYEVTEVKAARSWELTRRVQCKRIG